MPNVNIDGSLLLGELRKNFPAALMRADEPMSNHTTFRIGGPVRAMFFPESEEECACLIGLCARMGIEPFILGNGSNLLCSDAAMDMVVIKMRGVNDVSVGTDGLVRIGAGTLMRSAAQTALEHGLGGLEFAHGIPGTVGGGAFMNAGAYGGQMSQVIKSVRAVSADGAVRDIPESQLNYGYRSSRFEHSLETVLSVCVRLEEDDPAQIRARMDEYWAARVEKQPLDRPSAGSTFKRPVGGYAAAMIDQAGLKGFGFGGACVSEKHSGFVVSDGTATCEDVLMTMRAVREKVFKEFGVILEPEVRLIGVSL